MKKTQYEKDFKRLEEIMEKLESQQLPLEESLDLFQEGIALYKNCYDRLAESEEMLVKILEENGFITEKEV